MTDLGGLRVCFSLNEKELKWGLNGCLGISDGLGGIYGFSKIEI